VTKSRRPQRL